MNRRLLITFVSMAAVCADRVTFADDGVDFFESKIRPLFVKHCFECHADKKQKGNLRLDSRGGWQNGGDSGSAVVPGKPDESLLIKAVRYEDPSLEMPPDGKLTEAEIAALVKWVERGAPDPRDKIEAPAASRTAEIFAAAKGHWAYQPLSDPAPPVVKDASWPLSDIDRFLLARLEGSVGHAASVPADSPGTLAACPTMRPALDADRYTWLRRVTLDLTGLPPTPEEVAAFVDDPETDAHERVVDRLLASPAFGERWARHWLDLVGFADQIGTANDVFAEHAWRYRDYVIAAFNADKPFDQFVREQVAGDLLAQAGNPREGEAPAEPGQGTAAAAPARQEPRPPDGLPPDRRSAQLTATGFLLLGNVDIVESDKAKLRVDLVDQQIEKIGKVFLAQTINCARCHDHKFDPIRLTDYYGLAGIFGSTESVYETGQGVWSGILATELPETAEERAGRERRASTYSEKLAAMKAEIEKLTAQREEIAGKIKALAPDADQSARAELEKRQGELNGQIGELQKRKEHAEFFAVKPPRAYAVHDKPQPADARITIRGDAHALGDVVPRGFVGAFSHGQAGSLPHEHSGRLELAEWLTGPARPLTARVLVNRVWQKLFGEGLVRSVDYFGLRGESPSHPELLDHLATMFVRQGWSQKRLIRELVLTRAYRMESGSSGAPGDGSLTTSATQTDGSLTTSATGNAVDPDNRLLWRMNRVRLDAESLRDSILALGGDLLWTPGGSALPLEYLENVGNLSPSSVNPPSFSLRTFRPEQSFVRTVYLPVVRSKLQAGPADVLNFFDFAQPAQFTGQRPATAVPTQALFLLNSPLVKEQSQKLAARLLAETNSDDARLAALWLRVLNRPITPDESQAAKEFVADAASVGTPEVAWAKLCQALLISNEFLFRM